MSPPHPHLTPDPLQWPCVNVPARDKKVLTEKVGFGKTFMWSVCPASQDVGLDVVFAPTAKGASIVLYNEKERIASLQRGSMKAECDGVVTVTLDNTYSYLNSKTVHVSPPLTVAKFATSKITPDVPQRGKTLHVSPFPFAK